VQPYLSSFSDDELMSRKSYHAPWWLPGGHLQTIWPVLHKDPIPAYRRERIDTPDGDFIDIDWSVAGAPDKPLVVLFHGLEGSSRSPYARALMRVLQARDWRGVVPHFRGCSGELNRLSRAYHAGDSAEIDWILRHLALSAGAAPMFVVGISLGGNALLKWLGEYNRTANKLVAAAAAVCAPVDLPTCGHAMTDGFNKLYTWHLLSTLKNKALAKQAMYPTLFNEQQIRSARTLYDFDGAYTAPAHGFNDATDYWQRASSRRWLRHITVPTLLLCPENDSFVPAAARPGPEELSRAIRYEHPAGGGHVGFIDGQFPGHNTWLPKRLMEHFRRSMAKSP